MTRIPGTVVAAVLTLGEGAAIVEGPAGVMAVPAFDVDDPDTVVLATHLEVWGQVTIAGLRPVDVARMLTAREARASALAVAA